MKMDHEKILDLLAQRPPILLVDEAEDVVSGEYAIATWHVPEDMAIFEGHFPGNPVLPGVYTVESCAQTSILMFTTQDKYYGKTPLFLGINNVRFKNVVRPGDTLHLHATFLSEREEKAICSAHVDVTVNGVPTAEADVTLAFR